MMEDFECAIKYKTGDSIRIQVLIIDAKPELTTGITYLG